MFSDQEINFLWEIVVYYFLLMDSVEEIISELRDFVAESFLTPTQVAIIEARGQGSSYEALQTRFGLSGPTALKHCIIIIMLALPFALRATVKLRGVNERTLMKFQ